MRETWKYVVGFEGLYLVSDQGRVKSLRSGKILKPSKHLGGYIQAHLYKNGKRTASTIHKLVLEAFIGPRPAGQEARHVNGIRKDCRLVNLAYTTRDEKAALGAFLKTGAPASAKLTENDVRSIRARKGEKCKILAAEFGCTVGNISSILRGKSWGHVK